MSASKSGLPFLPWFPARFLSSTRGWSVTAKGLYRELIDAQWEIGGLPANAAELQRLIGATNVEWKHWPTLVEPKFPIDADGLRRNQATERHRAKSLGIRERNRAGAEKTNKTRWGSALRLVPNGVSDRSVSDQTAISERSQSIPIPIPIHSDAYHGGGINEEVGKRDNLKPSAQSSMDSQNEDGPAASKLNMDDEVYLRARREAAEQYAARNGLKRGAS
jgi:uncharacterized protein YdaU (DUF1376 family)